MLRGAIAFFLIGLIALILGANNLAGISLELGKLLLGVFVVLAVISLIAGLLSGRGPKALP